MGDENTLGPRWICLPRLDGKLRVSSAEVTPWNILNDRLMREVVEEKTRASYTPRCMVL